MACFSWWHQIFETDRRNAKRRTECFSEEVLHVCEEERSHTVILQNFINEILLRAAIHRFQVRARCRSTNHFPLSLTLLLLSEANKALEHLQKTSEKRTTLSAY